MLALLRALREIAGTMNLSVLQILSLIQTVLKLGMPPAITDTAALRTWFMQLTNILLEVSTVTPTPFDDKIALFLQKVLQNEGAWEIFVSIISAFFSEEGEAITHSMDTQIIAANELSAAIDPDGKAGLDPLSIMAIIQAVQTIISIWRKRKG